MKKSIYFNKQYNSDFMVPRNNSVRNHNQYSKHKLSKRLLAVKKHQRL